MYISVSTVDWIKFCLLFYCFESKIIKQFDLQLNNLGRTTLKIVKLKLETIQDKEKWKHIKHIYFSGKKQ